MELKKVLMLIMSLLLFGTAPAFADGAIPLWVLTIQDTFGCGIYFLRNMNKYDFGESINFIFKVLIISCIFLFIVVFIETIVFKVILKEIKGWKKLIKTVFISNFISATIGFLLLTIIWIVSYPPLDKMLSYQPFGLHSEWLPYILGIYGIFGGVGILISNIYYFIISYYSEYFISLKLLKKDSENKKIKKVVFWSNVMTYALPLIFSFIIIILQVMPNNHTMEYWQGVKNCTSYTGYFLIYCFGTIILPVILIGIGVWVIKKYIKKEEETKN